MFIQAGQIGPATNLPVTRIVIHGTVSPCRDGQARATARYFASTSRSASAHYVVDPSEIVQCASEATVCYHAPPNAHSIGVELCDPQSGPGSRWADAAHEAMLRRAADLVRTLAARHNVPVRHIGPAALLAGKHGICGHVDVTNAWHQTTHTDPGPDFPWAHFLDLVNGDDMPLTDSEIERVAAAAALKVWQFKNPKVTDRDAYDHLTHVPGDVWAERLARPGNDNPEAAGAQLGKANVYAYRLQALLDPDALAGAVAAAVAAKIPAGSLTAEQVRAAAADGFRDVLASIPDAQEG